MSAIGTVLGLAGVEVNGAVVESNGPLGTANSFWWGTDTSNSAALRDKTGIRPLWDTACDRDGPLGCKLKPSVSTILHSLSECGDHRTIDLRHDILTFHP